MKKEVTPFDSDDTIVALSSAEGESALAVIRCTGPLCVEWSRMLAPHGQELPARRAVLVSCRDLAATEIDKAIAIYYESGRSFTGEPSLEIFPHGNPLIIRRIIEDLIARGGRLAEPGEFTKRAYLNGRMDLSQAEAVMDLIRARSDRALEAAQLQLRGAMGRKVSDLREQLLGAVASLEAYIDFPEEDLPPEDHTGPRADLARIHQEMSRLEASRRFNEIMRRGLRLVIAGAPNAGKSSLLNAILGNDRVLVSAEPGTTRDYVEVELELGRHLIRLIDTAGLRESGDAIEEQGVALAREQIAEADCVLWVVDRAAPVPDIVARVIEESDRKPGIVALNKSDLPHHETDRQWKPGNFPAMEVSAKTGQGIRDLLVAFEAMIEKDEVVPAPGTIVVSERHADAVRRARMGVEECLQLLSSEAPLELAANALHESMGALSEITGGVDNESMLDALFARFCIGK